MEQKIFYARPWILNRYMKGPLSTHLEAFAHFLQRLGYSYGTGQMYVREIGRLSIWLERQKIGLAGIDDLVIKKYLRLRGKHLRSKLHCGPYTCLKEYLRQAGLIQTPSCHLSSLEVYLRVYRDHLLQNQGLAQETVRRHMRVARAFLERRVGDDSFHPSQIRLKDIVQHILERSQRIHLSIGTETSSLRSFMRFLQFRGDIPDDLVRSVPRVRHWAHSNLPSFLSSEQVRKLIENCDRLTPVGKRDAAIMLLLARLGLRGVEICRLRLEDINWQEGYIAISGKHGKRSRLPLLDDLGHAIADYLRYGRPCCSTRHVFVRSIPPFKPFASSCTVANVVRKALSRADLTPLTRGAHLLRRTFATQMLKQGASLTEISQILRHQSVDTTTIYAKIDLGRLRPVAHPWPGGRPS